MTMRRGILCACVGKTKTKVGLQAIPRNVLPDRCTLAVSRDLGAEVACNLIVLCCKTPVKQTGSEGENCWPLVYVLHTPFLLAHARWYETNEMYICASGGPLKEWPGQGLTACWRCPLRERTIRA